MKHCTKRSSRRASDPSASYMCGVGCGCGVG